MREVSANGNRSSVPAGPCGAGAARQAEAGAADLPALVRWKIRSWETHVEYDDILAQSYLLAWRAFARATAQGARSPAAVATHAAQYGPSEWLTRWFGDSRCLRHRFEHVSLDGIYDEPTVEWQEELLTRIEAERLWAWIEANCDERQREVLRRVLRDGEQQKDCCARLGVDKSTVSRIYHAAIDRCRQALL